MNNTEIPLGFVADESGNILSYRHKDGYTRIYTYDENGKIESTKTEDGYTSSFYRFEDVSQQGDIKKMISWENSLGMSAIYEDKGE